ncbi:MAG: type IV secretory system conjugative DNA transfer family protein [Candidatus Obscuribacterales bacterium]|nr:type IV secretory system conjugative DNA transfer family protein [Candidatus Obscuribacterales bacterium]
MPVQVQDSGIVETTAKEFPVLAVNVLERLGYHVSRASKQLDQILANERVEEQVGRDWWRHEYRVVLRWRKTTDGTGVLVSVDLSEHKGGGSQSDCQKRCDKILLELQHDAQRAAEARTDKEPNTSYGAARWGNEQELKAAGYFQGKPDPRRLIVGKSQTGEYLQVPEMLTYAHALVCGRTGVGKSRGFFIPQLIERTGTSMIVTEATPGYESGELYKLTGGWRKLAGHQVYCFNPADMTSHRINPIDRIRQAPQELKAALAEKLADLIIMNGEAGETKVDQTWNRSEKLLLIPLLMHAAASEPKYGHFGALRWLLLQGPDRLAKVLYHSPSDVAQMEFEGWMRLSGETNFKYGVFSGLITKLNPWMTDHMVALTETTDIDLEALKHELFTFYLAVPSRSRDSKLIGSLMVNFLLDHILEIREDMKYPLAMLLDEFTNFGKIAGIADTLSIIRKNKIGLVLGFQNYYQLEQVYSRREAQIILDMPATQVYFKQKNYREAKELSDALGRMTVEETTVTDSGRVQEFVQGRALATPEELINLKNEVIVFTPDTWPLKLPLTSPTAYDQALAYPPPERETHEVSEFVRTRGRAARQQQERPQQPQQSKKTTPGKGQNFAKNERDRGKPNVNRTEKQKEELRRKPTPAAPAEDDNPPDLGDVWQV